MMATREVQVALSNTQSNNSGGEPALPRAPLCLLHITCCGTTVPVLAPAHPGHVEREI